jgi:hypothetical protein
MPNPPVATATFEQAEHRRLNESTRDPRLHAFPEGSNVALCGRVRKPGEERASAGKRCRTCVEAASRKSFFVR